MKIWKIVEYQGYGLAKIVLKNDTNGIVEYEMQS